MSDPTTNNRLLAIPLRGTDSGQWDLPVNGNSIALDGMFGGVTSLSLTSATTILLTVPATGTVAAAAGPNQSQNALLKFVGTLTGNIVVQFTLPGFYIVHNLCVVGNSFVQLMPAAGTGAGNAIGAPPGKKCHVFFDGTSMDYVNMPDVGTAYDLHGATSIPPWMNACTVSPYLIKDGSIYNFSSYPALGAQLGSTFGGNGISTFGVPDELARARIGYDTQGTGRLTSGGSGVNGATMASAGGNQYFQQHNHALTDPGHVHAPPSGGSFQVELGGQPNGFAGGANGYQASVTGSSVTGITIAAAGSGSSQNVQPSIVSFLPLIKT